MGFIQSFFGAPAILVALFTLVGTLLERRKMTEVLMAVLLAAIGYTGIIAGTTVISQGLQRFGSSFQLLFGINGTMPYTDITASNIMSQFNDVAAAAALIMVVSMVLNIALARMSRFKYIFLTGHHIMFMSVMFIAFIQAAGFDTKIDLWLFVILGSVLMSIYMTLSPALTSKYMEFLTQDTKLYIGHFHQFGYALAGAIGDWYGKIKKGKVIRSSKINFPQWLGFFRNQAVSLAITMILLFEVLYCVLWGTKGMEALVAAGIFKDTSVTPAVEALIDAFTFTVGVEFLVYGIKMMIGELMPAIEGFAKSLIPGAKTAVDSGVTLHFSPIAVLIGFISSFLGGVVGMLISIGLNLIDSPLIPAVIIPGIVSHFFTGGTSGTFADIKGGAVGAFLGAFTQGLIQTLIPILLIMLSIKYNLLFDANLPQFHLDDPNWDPTKHQLWVNMYTETDFLVVWTTLGLFASQISIGVWILLGLAIAVYIALSVDGILAERKDRKKNPEKWLNLQIEKAHLKEEFKKRKDTEKQLKLDRIEQRKKKKQLKQLN